MRSNLFASTLAIALGVVSPIVGAIVFPEIVAAQVVDQHKVEADRLFEEGIQQKEISQFDAAFQSWQQALKLYRDRIRPQFDIIKGR